MKYVYSRKAILVFLIGITLGVIASVGTRYVLYGQIDPMVAEKVACKPWFDIPIETQQQLVSKHVTVRSGKSQGSGCLIKPGYYLTAQHILDSDSSNNPIIAVNEIRAKLISDPETNRKLDLAVLSTFAEIDKKETELESYNNFADNQDIIIVGAPGEMRPFAQPAKIIGDVLEDDSYSIKVDSKMISSQYIESGISGGCVYSADGQTLLGVVTKKYGTTSSIGEATFVSKPIK
jgi:hypothetical protein